MLPLETLKAARRLLSVPGAWTTETYAKDGRGCDVLPEDETASCWCILGALYRVTQHCPNAETNHPDVEDAAQQLLSAGGLPWPSLLGTHATERVFRWNDAPGRTQEEVLEVFDKAIEATAKRYEAEAVAWRQQQQTKESQQ